MPGERTGKGERGRGFRSSVLLSLACSLLFGCQTGTFPNPNNVRGAGELQPEVLRRQIKGASDALYTRVLQGEISDETYRKLMAEYAEGLLKTIDIENADPSKAWEYGEAFKTAKQWPAAERLYRIAVKAAKNEDRRVNDRLQLANALAHEGKVEEAIASARQTFDTPPDAKAPILYAILLEIVPAAKGQGHDADLARLLEDAIRQSDLVKVDPTGNAGKAFLAALPHHQRNARRLAAELYLAAGQEAEAERVLGGKLPSIKI